MRHLKLTLTVLGLTVLGLTVLGLGQAQATPILRQDSGRLCAAGRLHSAPASPCAGRRHHHRKHAGSGMGGGSVLGLALQTQGTRGTSRGASSGQSRQGSRTASHGTGRSQRGGQATQHRAIAGYGSGGH